MMVGLERQEVRGGSGRAQPDAIADSCSHAVADARPDAGADAWPHTEVRR